MTTKTPNNFPNGIIDIFKTFKVLDLNMMQVKKKGEVSIEMVLTTHNSHKSPLILYYLTYSLFYITLSLFKLNLGQ